MIAAVFFFDFSALRLWWHCHFRVKKKIKKTAPVRRAEGPHSRDRRLVLIDQIPLRREAEKKALKGLRETVRLRETVVEYERQILPEYVRWENETVGTLLAEERVLEAKLRELTRILEAVDYETLFYDTSPQQAYKEVMREMKRAEDNQRRAEARGFEDEPRDPEEEWDEEAGYSDNERAFRSFLRRAVGIDPDFLTKREYKKRLAEFLEKMGAVGSSWRPNPDEADIDSRVKELYRVLVRRLHPDTGASVRRDPLMAQLWHDLQDAYAKRNAEQLELLLAMTDLHEGHGGMKSTLFHMRRAASEFMRRSRELKGRVREIRTTEAWVFWHTPDRGKLAVKLKAEVEARVKIARKKIAECEAEIEILKSPARKRKTKYNPLGQDYFDF